jgi:hypothetical protein
MPAWVLRVPHALAVAALGSTALVLALAGGADEPVPAWGGWAGLAWWKDRAPYPAAAVHVRVTLRFTDFARFDRDARELGTAGLSGLVDQPDQRQFLGRVDVTTPPATRVSG